MISNFKEQLRFYFAHLFDTKYKMGIRQYKDQKLYVSLLTLLPVILFFIYIIYFNEDPYLYSDEFYYLPPKEQNRLQSANQFYFSLALIFAFLIIKWSLLPIEIKRTNFKGVNWKVRAVILILGFLLLIGWSFYRLHNSKPYYMPEIIFGTAILNLVFGNNYRETPAEKEAYKLHGEHR